MTGRRTQENGELQNRRDSRINISAPPEPISPRAAGVLNKQMAYLLRWIALTLPLGIVSGSACALFLVSLDAVTQLRFDHSWLIYGLPLAGLITAAGYDRFGRSVEAGNNLILAKIHQLEGRRDEQESEPLVRDSAVPFRMAPLVLIGTLLTHLCGGSAGREGTAVQMSGGIAGALVRWIPGLTCDDARLMLIASIAAGFGGVFGTPVAGAVFAIEVIRQRQLSHTTIVPCLLASIISDQACAAWGVGHTQYTVTAVTGLDTAVGRIPLNEMPLKLKLIGAAMISGIGFGLISRLYCELTHGVAELGQRLLRTSARRAVVGGIVVIALVVLTGATEYLGLGVSSPHSDDVTIVTSFRAGGADAFSWLWKTVLTALTVGSGFKGGEVTSLFMIGSTAGNTMATVAGLPVDLWAAVGFVAVFAGATNTPIACTIMAAELFGSESILYFAVSCGVASLFSGKRNLYAVPETARRT